MDEDCFSCSCVDEDCFSCSCVDEELVPPPPAAALWRRSQSRKGPDALDPKARRRLAQKASSTSATRIVTARTARLWSMMKRCAASVVKRSMSKPEWRRMDVRAKSLV
jgi:hypothetical protein